MLDPITLIDLIYKNSPKLKALLLDHSNKVLAKALEIAQNNAKSNNPIPLDLTVVKNGCLLHDIGIIYCNAPSILCNGPNPYLEHGFIGAKLLREYGIKNNLNLEVYARICERHTGSGLSAQDIKNNNILVPIIDYFPETNEEKLVCLADKFFSKSKDTSEKSFSKVTKSMEKFGPEVLTRFHNLVDYFGLEK
jgi:uncharacterized protein